MRVSCPHLPAGERFAVMPSPPRGVVTVSCPCCNLPGWVDDDDPEPMVCPYCGVDAAHNRPEDSRG